MGAEIFRIGDQIILKEGGEVTLTCETILDALRKGPLRVWAVISSPLAECACRGTPHSITCPVKQGLWGLVRHPQWLIVSDKEGNVIIGPGPMGAPMRFSGAWFTKGRLVAFKNSGVR